MSYATLVLGESGTGKTCSLRNLDPSKTLLIQPTRKPLPFRATGWKEAAEKGDGGNIFVSDDPVRILHVMRKAPHDIIIVDDWQYVLCNIFMARANDKGYEKFTQIGKAGFDILKAASELAPNKRVYVLAHTHTGDDGVTRIKTLGKMLDDKVVPEGMFTTVLRTSCADGKYFFLTQNSGSDTVKSPLGLFDSSVIDNDLKLVDDALVDFYSINAKQQ